jgi:hypothetical protein
VVARSAICAAFFVFCAGPTLADTALEKMFPGKSGCYARSYSAEHLDTHPAQRVTDISVVPEAEVADPMIGLWVSLTLRGVPGGAFEGLAYCENSRSQALDCGLEGDAGSFSITPAKNGAILIEVGRYGMSFENDTGFATLESRQGDDRSFILRPAPCR